VLVYKVDRLSRSLLDFARIMETFEAHQVAFVSVTQQFNTATSMGRLVLNVLLSFAQFEREIIAERTRDKIAAARRRGKWAGGMPLLGYDVDPRGSKLVVHEEEAVRVRAIFALYLEHRALLPVVQELEQRGWLNKYWQTRKGRPRGGRGFTKTSLYRLLTNVVYLGKIKYRTEIHDGEHQGIVDPDLWQQVQDLLHRRGHNRSTGARNGSWALLKGVLRCRPCGCAMTPTYANRNGCVRYRYYVCMNAVKRGRQVCPSKSIPATEIEQFVVQQLQELAEDSKSAPGQILAPLADLRAWAELPTEEQARVVRRLVQSVDYDGSQGKVSITLRPADSQELTGEWANHKKEKSR
jgi:site-specific DNA recombinase